MMRVRSISLKFEALGFLSNHTPAGRKKIKAGAKGAYLSPTSDALQFCQRHSPVSLASVTIIAVEGLLRPRIQAVDIAMSEIERPLMGLKGSSF